MGALIPLILQIAQVGVPWLVQMIEAKHGPGGGPDVKKPDLMNTLLSIVLPALDRLFANTGVPVNQDAVTKILSKLVDDTVAAMNSKGDLPKPNAPASGTLTINGTLQVGK